jgi:hypothetical protein
MSEDPINDMALHQTILQEVHILFRHSPHHKHHRLILDHPQMLTAFHQIQLDMFEFVISVFIHSLCPLSILSILSFKVCCIVGSAVDVDTPALYPNGGPNRDDGTMGCYSLLPSLID